MTIHSTGTPVVTTVRFDSLTQGDTFCFNVSDAESGNYFLIDNAGLAVGINGGRQSVPGDQQVINVTVNAVVSTP